MKNISIDQKGRSMIEMLGVLAIVGVLSVAGIAGYSKAMAKYKINKMMDQVSTLAANTKTLFASVGDYSGLIGTASTDAAKNERAYKLGLFPDDMVKACSKTGAVFATSGDSTSCVKNAMNGDVTVTSSANDFTIKFDGLTKEACTALFTSDWGGAAGFKSIKGPAGNAYTPADLVSTGTYSAAKTACATQATDNGYSVTWVFY